MTATTTPVSAGIRLLAAAADHYDIPTGDIMDSRIRHRRAVQARRVVAYIASYHLLLDIPQTALLLGVSESTVKRLRRQALDLVRYGEPGPDGTISLAFGHCIAAIILGRS